MEIHILIDLGDAEKNTEMKQLDFECAYLKASSKNIASCIQIFYSFLLQYLSSLSSGNLYVFWIETGAF